MNATLEPEHPLKAVEKPELVFGIVGPVGVDVEELTDVLGDELERVGYRPILVRLSGILAKIKGLGVELHDAPEDQRIDSHMTAGTKLREVTGWGDVLAQLGLLLIRDDRERATGSPKRPNRGTAHIIRSLKHESEINLLRDVYGDGFIAVSAYSPRDQRLRSLAKSIAASNNNTDVERFLPEAQMLVNRDEREGSDLGQNVANAFPKADLFVDASSRQTMRSNVARFVELFFGNPFLTPTKDEFGMYQAAAASLRSSDLSRHVGAALMSKDGDLISVGCNDIPKFGGGSYWCDDAQDGRDYQRGYDSSTVAKREVLAETLDRLKRAGMIASDAGLEELVDSLLWGEMSRHMRDAQITNLLEFGRAVHAEMSAITDASKRGIATRGATLYTTTFPCHMCARLIIAAGIERVVFVEPYPKSKTHDLYSDSVAVGMERAQPGYVNFDPFVGVAPEKYGSLFRMFPPARKDKKGSAVKWMPLGAAPRLRRFALSYLTVEEMVTNEIESRLDAFGLELL